MGPCIITCSKYNELALNILSDTSTFELLPVTSDHSIIEDYLQDLKNSQVGSMVTPEKHSCPSFKGMPKVHKNPVKLRPVVDASNCFTTKLSKLLHLALTETKQIVYRINDILVPSTDKFIQKLSEIPESEVPKLRMDALDVESLYTNIPHEVVLSAVNFFTCYLKSNTISFKFEKQHITITVGELIKLVRIYLKYNILFYPEQKVWYKQIKGIPTGGNVSPVLADLSMSYFEVQVKDNMFDLWRKYHYSGRYLDDLLILTSDESYSPEKFQEMFYNNVFILKVTCENDDDKIFLDLTVKQERDNCRMSYKLYRKPGNAYNYIHNKSFLAQHVKTSFIRNEFNRIRKRCYYDKDYISESQFFTERLLKRGYSKTFIESCISLNHNTSKNESQHWSVLFYQEDVNKSDLVKLLDKPEEEVSIAFRNQKNLKSYLS
jgi:hypothetical protein